MGNVVPLVNYSFWKDEHYTYWASYNNDTRGIYCDNMNILLTTYTMIPSLESSLWTSFRDNPCLWIAQWIGDQKKNHLCMSNEVWFCEWLSSLQTRSKMYVFWVMWRWNPHYPSLESYSLVDPVLLGPHFVHWNEMKLISKSGEPKGWWDWKYFTSVSKELFSWSGRVR